MVAELYSLLITLDGPCQMERTEHSHPNNTLMQSYLYIKGKPYLIRPITELLCCGVWKLCHVFGCTAPLSLTLMQQEVVLVGIT